eukprot:5653844-Amphidinium_carterae.1
MQRTDSKGCSKSDLPPTLRVVATQGPVVFSSLPCGSHQEALVRPAATRHPANELQQRGASTRSWTLSSCVGGMAIMTTSLLSSKRKEPRTTRRGVGEPARGQAGVG